MKVNTTASAQRARITLYHCTARSPLTSLSKTNAKKKLWNFLLFCTRENPHPVSFTYGRGHQNFPGSGPRVYFLNEHYRRISKAVTCEAFGAPGAPGSLGVPDLLFTGGCHQAEDQSSSASHLPPHWLWKDWVCSPAFPSVFLKLG